LAQLLGISQSTLSKYRSQLNIEDLGTDYQQSKIKLKMRNPKIKKNDVSRRGVEDSSTWRDEDVDAEDSDDSLTQPTPPRSNITHPAKANIPEITRREGKAIHRLRKIRDSLDDENPDIEKLRKRLGKLHSKGFLERDPDELLNSVNPEK